MTRTRLVTAMMVVCALGMSVPAAGHDHKRPKTVLRSSGERQVARPWSFEWSRADGKFCVGVASDGVPNYDRKPMRWNPERKIHLRLFKRQRPDDIRIKMHRRLAQDGLPAGRGKRADINLRRVRLDGGRRIWIAGFEGLDARHLFLDAYAEWSDVEGCGGSQSMSLAFHLKRSD